MKFNNFADNEVEVIGENQSLDFSIDTESLGILFKGFSDNLYSDKIGSIVREIASNCFDAHEEINQPLPVKIKAREATPFEEGQIVFEDFGPGLSPERIKKIYSRYFASTKRDTNDQIGGFGIGAKSPLAYTSSFNVVTRVNGIEYNYVIHRGEQVPVITLIDQFTTDKINGTKVIIPIESARDYREFVSALRTQLKYFDNIDYKIAGENFDNDYKIYRGKNWIYRKSSDNHDTQMEICIGKVAYPLNFNQIFERSYYSDQRGNFALYFNVGELSVTMNREAVEYNKRTIAIIQQRIKECYAELEDLQTKNRRTDSLSAYAAMRSDRNRIRIQDEVFLKGSEKFVPAGKEPIYIPFENTTIKIPQSIYGYLELHKIVGFDRSTGNTLRSNYGIDGVILKAIDPDYQITTVYHGHPNIEYNIYRVRGKMSSKTSDYLLDTVGNYVAIRNRRYDDSMDEIRYWNYISKDPAEQELYKKHTLKLLLGVSKSFDDVEIPQTWLDNNKTIAKRKVRSAEMFPFKLLQFSEVYGVDCEFRMCNNKIGNILKSAQYVIYGANEDDEKLKSIFPALSSFAYRERKAIATSTYSHPTIEFGQYAIIKISKAAFKFFEGEHSCMHVDEFFAKSTSLFNRMFMAEGVSKLLDSNARTFGYNLTASKEVSETLFPAHIYKFLRKIYRSSVPSGYLIELAKTSKFTYLPANHFVKIDNTFYKVSDLAEEINAYVKNHSLLPHIDSFSSSKVSTEVIQDYLNLKPFNSTLVSYE